MTQQAAKGIIAAGHEEVVQAGAEILRAGGNAFDAALAAMLTSFVAEPSLTSMAGGGFFMAHTATGQQTLYDFFVHTPLHRRPLEELDFVETLIDFGTATQLQYIGKGSVAVPGCPAGMFAVHNDLGYMPINEVAQPAINLARRGCKMTPYQTYTFSILKPVLLHSSSVQHIYGREGRLLQTGDYVLMPDFADALEYLANSPKREFYEGEIGRRFAQDNLEHGGSVLMDDLETYEVIKRKPLKRNYRGHELLMNPRPSAGGSMISFGLALLEKFDMSQVDAYGFEYIKLLADVMRGMELMRGERLNQYNTGLDLPEQLFQEQYIRGVSERVHPMGNTTQISVLDKEGNAASVTTTLGGGSGHTVPGLGCISNNMLGETDLNPNGLYMWEPNQRVSSMMSPTIVLKEGKPWLALGSGGSSRIRTAIMQVLINLIDHKMSLEEAIHFPRLHWENNILNVEPGLVEHAEQFKMEGTETTFWKQQNMFFGGVHTAMRTSKGKFKGLGDERRDGSSQLV